jgi:hypothetical protein
MEFHREKVGRRSGEGREKVGRRSGEGREKVGRRSGEGREKPFVYGNMSRPKKGLNSKIISQNIII